MSFLGPCYSSLFAIHLLAEFLALLAYRFNLRRRQKYFLSLGTLVCGLCPQMYPQKTDLQKKHLATLPSGQRPPLQQADESGTPAETWPS